MRTRIVMLGVVAVIVAMSAGVDAQNKNPRFGRWKIKSDAPAPSSNIMTYEPLGAKGMKVTVEAVNPKGETSKWWYETQFDGKDMPVSGQQPNQTSAVTMLNDKVNVITNKRDGKTTQVLTNVLSPDGNTIGVIYMRDDGMGKTIAVTFATYERLP